MRVREISRMVMFVNVIRTFLVRNPRRKIPSGVNKKGGERVLNGV